MPLLLLTMEPRLPPPPPLCHYMSSQSPLKLKGGPYARASLSHVGGFLSLNDVESFDFQGLAKN